MSWIVEIKFEIDEVENADVFTELLSNLGDGILNGDNLISFSIKENPEWKGE